MNEQAAVVPVVEASALLPSAKELRALRLFVSADETRFSLATLWTYASDGGATYVASDGHTIAVRRSGTHRTMALHDIQKLPVFAVDENGVVSKSVTDPPRWAEVTRPMKSVKLASAYGFSPDYIARIGDVERAAGARSADDYVPSKSLPTKYAKQQRASLKRGEFASWVVPSDPLDGWFWSIEAPAARWEGIVMPRRV